MVPLGFPPVPLGNFSFTDDSLHDFRSPELAEAMLFVSEEERAEGRPWGQPGWLGAQQDPFFPPSQVCLEVLVSARLC